jgi:hypothetical protein
VTTPPGGLGLPWLNRSMQAAAQRMTRVRRWTTIATVTVVLLAYPAIEVARGYQIARDFETNGYYIELKWDGSSRAVGGSRRHRTEDPLHALHPAVRGFRWEQEAEAIGRRERGRVMAPFVHLGTVWFNRRTGAYRPPRGEELDALFEQALRRAKAGEQPSATAP